VRTDVPERKRSADLDIPRLAAKLAWRFLAAYRRATAIFDWNVAIVGRCDAKTRVNNNMPRVNRTMRSLLLTVLALLSADVAAAQATNPRFGKWKLKSDAPAPSSNVMTYEPYGARGMKVVIDAVNARGETSRWWYVTEFDGKDMPVTGNASTSHTAVRQINDRINEIINKKDGKVTQVLTNVLSPDGNTIAVMYMRDDGTGRTTNVTFATYERCPAC
jgi:hypothetical protein